MSRHQARLLLCSAASVALIASALFVLDWFRIDLAGTHMTIGMRSGTVCLADGTCTTVGLRGMGAYRVLAEGAFWNGMLLALLVLAQCGMRVFGGSASQLATRIGYAIGSITFLCAFGAGYMFAPEPPAELDVLGLVVVRTFAPAMLVIGSLLGVLAVRYAQLEQVSDDVAEYKPVVVRRDGAQGAPGRAATESGVRARAASESGVHARAPSEPGVRMRAASESGVRTRTQSQQIERIALPGDRTKAPSQQPAVARTTSSQSYERIPLPGDRTKAPSQQPAVARTTSASQSYERIALPGDRTKAPSQQPAVARTTSPSQSYERIALPGDRTKAPSQQPAVARTTSPPQSYERIALPGERTKAPSQPGEPALARTTSPSQPLAARTRSPSQQPLAARTTSESQQPLAARTKSASQQPVGARAPSPARGIRVVGSDELAEGAGLEIPSRARTSSSGPIDLAARLSGAPIAVAIKPPLPEPVPVPPDQIPVAPESGLVIRKRTPSAGPLSAHQLPAAAAPGPAAPAPGPAAPAPGPAAPEHIPVPPESGLVIRKKPSQPDMQLAAREAARQAFGTTEAPRGPSGMTPPGAMPSIALRTIDPDIDNPLAEPVQSQLPADPPSLPVVARAFTPPDKPAALRGKLKYAVNLATLTSLGITAQREDGTTKHVGWDDIIGIIARRLPAEAPYEGATFVDLVSMAGSTLRVLPWTRLDGAPVRGDGAERARAFVQMIAARCLDAKLDSWTKVFADGAGHAAQLPSAKTLAAHDDKLA